MKKELLALLDKRRALKAEADAINTAADKADGVLTTEQTSRLKDLHGESDAVTADLERLAAAMPEGPAPDPQVAINAAVTASVTATREAAANVAAACHIARQSAKASAFITEGKTMTEVMAALQTGKADASGNELRTHGLPGSTEVKPIASAASIYEDRRKARAG